MIGTVSPAGGNFEEPVTQSTLSAVKCFLGLSAERAYKRFYPAVDPLLSWSRYREQLADWYAEHMGQDWVPRVEELETLLLRGSEVQQMIQVTGEEGVTLEDFTLQQAALFLDMVYLQQDAFDEIDAAMPLDRQKQRFDMVFSIATRRYAFKDKATAREHFTRMTGLFKNLNYAAPRSTEEKRLKSEIESLDRSVPMIRGEEGSDNGAAETGTAA